MKPINPQQLKPKAAEIFTDREAPRAAFWKVYHTMERGEIEIINYYGVGGIGKTSLLKQIRSELDAAGNHKHVEYSFENRKTKDRILFDLSRQLMKKCDGLRFPIFDYAFEKYQILCGEEQLGKNLLEKESVLDHHLVGSALSVMGDYVPFVGTVSSVITESTKAIQKLAKKYEQIRGSNAQVYQEISALDAPNELFSRLQYYFSLDAYPYFSSCGQRNPLVILLDGYEILVNRLQDGDKAAAEDLWLRGQGGLIPSIPNTIWVIAGREKLDWGEAYIPQDHSHLIGNLARTDAMQFFEASGISDPDLAAGLCELTDGTPVYMDLCVKQYNRYLVLNGGKAPDLQEFGKNTEEIAIRFLRDMSIMEQGILRLLSCLPNTWSDALVMELAQKMHYDFSMNEYRLIKEMTLIEAVDSESGMFRLHETFRKIVYAQIRDPEKQDILNALKDIFVEWLIDRDKIDDLYYCLASIAELFQRNARFLSLRYEDAKKIAWAVAVNYQVNGTGFELFSFYKAHILASKDAEWVKMYIAFTRREIESLSNGFKNEEALTAAKDLYDRCLHEACDAESKTLITYLYGYRLFISEHFAECRPYLEDAVEAISSSEEISYSCKMSVLIAYAEYIDYYQEDSKTYARIQELQIQACDEELARLDAIEAGRKNDSAIENLIMQKADALYCCDCDAQALELLRSLLDRMLRNGSPVHRIRRCKSLIADICMDMDRYEEAEANLQDVLKSCLQAGQEESLIDIYDSLGRCKWFLGEEDAALEFAQKSLDQARISCGEVSIETADQCLNLAKCYRSLEDYNNAESLFLKAYEIKCDLLGPDDSEACRVQEDLANCYFSSGKPEKAYGIWDTLYEKYGRIFGKDHRKTLYALYKTGSRYFDSEEYEEARKRQETAFLAMAEQGTESRMSDLADELASTCYMMDDYGSALKYETLALSMLDEETDSDKTSLFSYLSSAYAIYIALGDQDHAYETVLKLYDIVKFDIDFWDNDYWHVYSDLGDCFRKRNEPEKALQIHRECLVFFSESADQTDAIEARIAVSSDLNALGRHEDALAMDLRTYRTACELFGENAPQTKLCSRKIAFDRKKLDESAAPKNEI